jgi:DNA-binding CsgD family transcriptional regulator
MLEARSAPLVLTPKERQICDLLIAGAENEEIGRLLQMAPRTVKAHFARMFTRNGITGGIKRVKLAVLYYREQRKGER